MGWTSYAKDGTILSEGANHGRPVKEGEEGNLAFIEQDDYGHRVGVDLHNGVILIDYDSIDFQPGGFSVENVKTVLYICDETVIAGELTKVRKTKPDKDGWFDHIQTPYIWRPIWFSRVLSTGVTIKCIGAQTTLTAPYKRRNVKKMVSLFPDGRIGIY